LSRWVYRCRYRTRKEQYFYETVFTLATVVATSGLLFAGALAGAASASASVAASRPQPSGTIIRTPGNSGLPTISENWSGYAATSAKKFNFVSSQFVQPKVSCPGKANQFMSNWVGLDGFTTGTVEQTGTLGFCGGKKHTTPQYEAWYEMFPAGSVNVFKVKPGDIIDTAVKFTGGKFNISIGDVNSGKHFAISKGCASCERASAEWIIERPALCNNTFTKCFITALADYHTLTMGQDRAQVAGGKVKGIGAFNNVPIFMVNPVKSGGFISLDQVSALSGSSFEAQWLRSGSTVPITLGPGR
jgi:Peptidase A4 family